MLPSFGQSSSPFGSQSVFGQTSSASSNPFAPKPFGSTSPFGAQTGGSVFGGTSTGVFGASAPSSSLSSSTPFGASSSPAFGSSMPSFGASPTPPFGSSASSSAFGGSSLFGAKPAFSGFGSSTTQSSPFGSTPQSQPAFGSSSLFGGTSQPAFGAASAPAFGQTSSPTFGATSTPAFGAPSTSPFGTSTPLGSTTPTFGNFGSTVSFNASSTPAYGSTFGASGSPAFAASSTPAFSASTSPFSSSSPSFSFGSSTGFGQSASTFGSSTFPSTASPFGSQAQSSPFGSQTTTFGSTAFGSSAFGSQRGGSRVATYTATAEVDSSSGAQTAGKLESISAMPVYKDKSHEELRWEDYQLGDKGGPTPVGQSATGISFNAQNTQQNPFGASPSLSQSMSNPFSGATSSNPFAAKTPTFNTSPFATSSSGGFNSSAFSSALSTSNPFGSTSSATQSLFPASSTPSFGNTSPSLFGPATSSSFGSAPSLFNSASAPGSAPSLSPSLNFGNTQSMPLFQSTPSAGQTGTGFGQATATFNQSTTPFNQPSLFNQPSSAFNTNLFSSSSSLLSSSNAAPFSQATPSLSSPFQSVQPSLSATGYSFSNFGQAQGSGAGGFGSGSSIFQSSLGPLSASLSSAIMQPAPVTNPFGTLPAMPQVSISRAGTGPSVQYGISSMPVVEKPAPVRVSSLLTSRHLSQRRLRLPARKYHPKSDGPKVPFFSDDEDTPSTPKADALFVPRENPRALVIRPMEQWPMKGTAAYSSNDKFRPVHENGNAAEDGLNKEPGHAAKPVEKPNGVHDDHQVQKEDSYIKLTGNRAGEAAIVYEHGADIEALMPKLRRSDYYTEPKIQELAAKERAEPGFCRHVKDFVVGRHGYGSIKFTGETDVRRLDLESLIQFNDREVIVYMDDSKKPPVGQGLNKPAEVTLLNIKCFDKKTGQQYTEGPKIEKYKDMLKRKAEDQGAVFVSYDPIKGQWKFRVNHFSSYRFLDEYEDGGFLDGCCALFC